ncbi:carboxypeptidase regulatory-like domain-containing protein [Granulicella sp. L56]|uniref:carboxypeptidase regulatory-like domain-containing protein n=1 Tax=Granulicella sp. L56 TaxID=1747222 RepID=UPI00131C8047|nr:carboxypeptidase regulatory-like domain-containing protein [Granulicella sp. L56]
MSKGFINVIWSKSLQLCEMTAFVLLLVFGIFAGTMQAQDYRAKLTVTVVDGSGAIVPNAALELERGSTKTVTPAKTDAGGNFTFLFLEPDTYTVKASAPSFSTAEVTNIILQSYAATNVSLTLRVATASSQVTVTSSGALLQTETASRAWNIDHQSIELLPIPNGNPVMLGADLPGVYMRPLGIYTDPWTVTSQYLINGGLMYLNEFQIDGSPNDAELGSNTYAYTPPAYAVGEFTVNANTYDAQYGHTSGGVINMTTMSGTSKIHGMGWMSLRRTGWNANLSQNKYQNSINNTNVNKRPFNSQTQLGGEVDGPLVIPWLVSRTSQIKPFYFVAFDHYTELLPRGLLLSYPTAKMRTGDFSELLNDPTGFQSITINDPTTTHLDPVSGHYVRDPFPGNIIPQSRINPIAAAVAKVFPTVGNSPAGQRIGANDLSIPNNYYNWHFRNWLGRLDVNVGDKYKFFIRPDYADFTEVSNAGGIVGPGENGGQFSRASKGFLIDFVDAINPTTVLNVRYGYQFFRVLWTSPANTGFDLTSLGLPSSFTQQLQQPALFGNYGFQGYSPAGWFANVEDTGTRSLEGSITKSAGKHNIHLGWDTRLTHFTFINPGAYTFTSNNDLTSADWTDTSSQSTSGDGFATFLLGTPSTGNTSINASELISTYYIAPWVQDDWKVTSRLTLNLGFRWDVLTAPTDHNNALNVGFDPNIPNAIQSQISPGVISQLPQASNLTGGLLFAGVNGNSRSPFATVYHNFQPRFGMSWSPINRLVLRGGYGLFYTNFETNGMIQQLGFSTNTNLTTSNDGGKTTIPNVLDNPYPNGLQQPHGSALGTLTGIGQTITTYNRNYKIPSANEFSFGLQFQVTHSSVLDAAYVGNRVNGYGMTYDANLPNWNFQQTCDEVYANGKNSNCTNQLTNPFQGIAAFNGSPYYTASTYDAYNLNRPHPEFQAVNTSGLNEGHNFYNGLQVDYSQRLWHGLTLNTSYVWSKQIEQWGWLNQALNLRQRSPYYLGLPHVFKVRGTYVLPIGRGRLINFNQNRIADSLLGGWSISPDFTVQNGEPASLPANAYPLPHNKFFKNLDWHKNQVQAWGNCVLSKQDGVISIPGGPTGATASRCGTDLSNYDWVEVPLLENEQAQPSNSSIIRMKPSIESDLAVEKNFKIERVNVIFRAQATNALNHFNILTARFDTNPNDGANFGTIYPGQTSTADSPPRNINLSLKASF